MVSCMLCRIERSLCLPASMAGAIRNIGSNKHEWSCWQYMTFPDIIPSLKAKMSALRGRLLPNEPLAPLTWFRVGGPAQALFMPEDEADLADLLKHLPDDIPVTV